MNTKSICKVFKVFFFPYLVVVNREYARSSHLFFSLESIQYCLLKYLFCNLRVCFLNTDTRLRTQLAFLPAHPVQNARKLSSMISYAINLLYLLQWAHQSGLVYVLRTWTYLIILNKYKQIYLYFTFIKKYFTYLFKFVLNNHSILPHLEHS